MPLDLPSRLRNIETPDSNRKFMVSLQNAHFCKSTLGTGRLLCFHRYLYPPQHAPHQTTTVSAPPDLLLLWWVNFILMRTSLPEFSAKEFVGYPSLHCFHSTLIHTSHILQKKVHGSTKTIRCSNCKRNSGRETYLTQLGVRSNMSFYASGSSKSTQEYRDARYEYEFMLSLRNASCDVMTRMAVYIHLALCVYIVAGYAL